MITYSGKNELISTLGNISTCYNKNVVLFKIKFNVYIDGIIFNELTNATIEGATDE